LLRGPVASRVGDQPGCELASRRSSLAHSAVLLAAREHRVAHQDVSRSARMNLRVLTRSDRHRRLVRRQATTAESRAPLTSGGRAFATESTITLINRPVE